MVCSWSIGITLSGVNICVVLNVSQDAADCTSVNSVYELILILDSTEWYVNETWTSRWIPSGCKHVWLIGALMDGKVHSWCIAVSLDLTASFQTVNMLGHHLQVCLDVKVIDACFCSSAQAMEEVNSELFHFISSLCVQSHWLMISAGMNNAFNNCIICRVQQFESPPLGIRSDSIRRIYNHQSKVHRQPVSVSTMFKVSYCTLVYSIDYTQGMLSSKAEHITIVPWRQMSAERWSSSQQVSWTGLGLPSSAPPQP